MHCIALHYIVLAIDTRHRVSVYFLYNYISMYTTAHSNTTFTVILTTP